ncbi:5-formyltetrahydrofolate cyclo-ligase [Sedimentibacter sp. zth1]|uniref:5-formyltetrahydrofolate cyclo-ligase n=1 Tax=Sedimentibacter sp. zth1 TaxID=2816908 RepID=UPI001A935461|nr:5-formyltetrahydrofolate cyclo-ligase [Sedimentibacter sp. zth1]QSX05151.1 5-formyltetrahydrofolate cyclo-ligase [Sedimentibacter sp. zth1]
MKTKSEIRKEILNIRKNLSVEEAVQKSAKIISKLKTTSEYNNSKTIMVYMDFKNEVNTKILIEEMFSEGKEVIIPYTDMEDVVIIPVKISDMKDLVYCKYGYLEPKIDMIKNPFDVKSIDLIIIPGVVFDKNRNRVGFGKGYYDKLLVNKREDAKSIALAYDFQVLNEVPAEEHDIKMDKIITETLILN